MPKSGPVRRSSHQCRDPQRRLLRRKLAGAWSQRDRSASHPELLLPIFLNPRFRSLPRANAIVLGSFIAALPMSHFPHLETNYWLALPLVGILVGTLDTMRCMRTRWDFYHGGVILCVYMDLMILILVLFLLLYPLLS